MGKNLLLVEGKDDEHVFKAIFGQHDLPRLDGVHEYGGYPELLARFSGRLYESDVVAVGMVVDADLNVADRWREIQSKLTAAGYLQVPSAPDSRGLVLEAPPRTTLPRFGAWIMPDNTLPGILENFLETLVPPEDELYAHVLRSVQTIPMNARYFRAVDLPKVNIHTYLAWQDEPGRPLGQSITRRVLQAGSPTCLRVVDWLKRLYFE